MGATSAAPLKTLTRKLVAAESVFVHAVKIFSCSDRRAATVRAA